MSFSPVKNKRIKLKKVANISCLWEEDTSKAEEDKSCEMRLRSLLFIMIVKKNMT